MSTGDVFTQETEQAVRSFQEQHARAVTGRADPVTLREIERAAEQRTPGLTIASLHQTRSNHCPVGTA